MKKFLMLATILSMAFFANAQKGNNQIGVAFEAGLPFGYFGKGAKTGLGGLLKGLYGIGEAGQISFTTGYSNFSWKNLGSEETGNSWIVPFLVGYRHNFEGFYVEPQLGYGVLGSNYNLSGISSTASTGAFTWGAGVGFAKNGFDGGIRYQGLSKNGTVSVIGFHIGYNFSIGAK
ncbi:MAG TPA: hypothetical protein VFP87_07730 [Chitinophagaceae bacterium]|nr:hypothetical protein [Chitinophagaceae bacterium]